MRSQIPRLRHRLRTVMGGGDFVPLMLEQHRKRERRIGVVIDHQDAARRNVAWRASAFYLRLRCRAADEKWQAHGKGAAPSAAFAIGRNRALMHFYKLA